MATASSSEVDELRRRMAEIRKELHQDVRDVVVTAESVTDWRRYLRMYPWLSMGVALSAGYLIVPRRHPKVLQDGAAEALAAQLRQQGVTAPKEKERSRLGLLGVIFGMVGPVVVRAAQGYAAQYLEQWIAHQQQAMAARPTFGQPGMSGGPGRPGRPEGGAQR